MLGLEVIGEGVETVTQLGELRDLGCEHLQGYLISKPVDAATAQQMVAKGWRFSTVSGMPVDTDTPANPLELSSDRARA